MACFGIAESVNGAKSGQCSWLRSPGRKERRGNEYQGCHQFSCVEVPSPAQTALSGSLILAHSMTLLRLPSVESACKAEFDNSKRPEPLISVPAVCSELKISESVLPTACAG